MSYIVTSIQVSQIKLAIQALKDQGYKLAASKRLHDLLAKNISFLFGGVVHSERVKVIPPKSTKIKALSLHEVLDLAGVPPQIIRENQ